MATNPAYIKKKKKSKAFIISLIIGLIIMVACLVVILGFHVNEVTYSGNNYYTDEELNQELLGDSMSGNSLYLLLKYNVFSQPDIRFIQKVKVALKSPGHVEFQVVEKVTAGCVEYLGNYMYFDNEGVVVESSSVLNEGITVITGLVFDHLVLGEKISVEDDSIFQKILELSQLLTKKKLQPDNINFDGSGNMILTFGKARIYLGDEKNLKLKISDLYTILSNIKGESGELHMENYSEASTSIAFIKDKVQEEVSSSTEEASSGAEENQEQEEQKPESSQTQE